MNNFLEFVDIQALLKSEREKRRMTYEDVANGLGCSASYVYRIEMGRRKKPSYEIVSRMVNFFNLTEEDLMKYSKGSVISFETKPSVRLEKELLQFIRKMNPDSFQEIKCLVKKIKEYQTIYLQEYAHESKPPV